MPARPNGQVGYKVTAATVTTTIGYDGNPIEGTTYTYEATNGYTGRLFIAHPVDRDPVAVQAAVAGDLRAVLAALAVSGTIGG